MEEGKTVATPILVAISIGEAVPEGTGESQSLMPDPQALCAEEET